MDGQVFSTSPGKRKILRNGDANTLVIPNSDPQRVPNFTTAAESLRQFWFRLFPFSPRNGSCGHFQRLQCCESWAADVCVDCNLGTAGKITSIASLNNTPQRQVQFAVRLEF
jgi:hypothetical protein